MSRGRDLSEPYLNATPALSAEAMWECTTCGACAHICPVAIEQMPKIVDTRRFLVMEDAEFPDTMQQSLQSLETRGHPLRGTAFSRVDWAQGLNITTMAETKDAEVLLWVGCGVVWLNATRKSCEQLPSCSPPRASSSPSGRGEMHGPSCAVHRQRVSVRNVWPRKTSPRSIVTTSRNRHVVPALLQHLSQRVSAIWRQVRGAAPQ